MEKRLIDKNKQQIKQPVLSDSGEDFLPNLCQGRAVFVMILVTELLVLTMVLAASGIRAFAWEDFALISLFVLWVVLVSAALLCTLRRWLDGWPLPAAVATVMAMIALVTLVFTVIAEWALAGADLQRLNVPVEWSDVVRNLLVSLVMSGLALRYFYVQAQLRKQERAELQSRIQALQSRIKPHFLFNSMNSIASLISVEPETAEQAVEDLCELFRASLRDSAEPVPLSQELDLCRRYMAIEQLRLGDRLRVNWQLENLPEQATLPLLTLQPVLENAVYHGIQPLPQGGEITVQIDVITEQKTPVLLIRVSNPVQPATAQQGNVAGHRMALDNIRARLAAFYNGRAQLDIEQHDGQFVTSLRVPFKEGG